MLAPGARFVILEFSTPPVALVRAAYHAYFHHVLPAIGGVVSRASDGVPVSARVGRQLSDG